jgi:hypothetical protein
MARHHNQISSFSAFSGLASPYGAVTINRFTPMPGLNPAPQAKTPEQIETAPTSRYLPIKKMALAYSDFVSEGALRHLVWQAEAYEKAPKSGLKSNGFLAVIVRPPGQRKVLLDRVEFEKWLTSQQRNARQGA